MSITSCADWKLPFLNQMLDSYAALNADVTVALSTTYPFEYSGSVNIVKIEPMQQNTWACHQYLFEHYKEYDYVGSTDDDILFTQSNLDYYINNQNLPQDYIPGFLHYDLDANGNKRMISVWPSYHIPFKKVVVNGKEYRKPTALHSALFLSDTKRFELAGMTPEPKSNEVKGRYLDLPSTSRSEIYLKLNKLVDINDSGSLLHHLPNNFHNRFGHRTFPTLDECLNNRMTS